MEERKKDSSTECRKGQEDVIHQAIVWAFVTPMRCS